MTHLLEAGTNASPEETVEGTNSEEVTTEETEEETEVDETNDESDEEVEATTDTTVEDESWLTPKQKKNAEKVKKILSDRNELKTRVEILEREWAIKDLRLKYGEFDDAPVIAKKELHPTLSYDECFVLANGLVNKQTEEHKQNLWIVGTDVRPVDSNVITYQELSALDQDQYAIKRNLIDSGKLKLINKQ